MPLEYEAIRQSFNRIAKQYEENAILQKEVLGRLLERLHDEQILDAKLKPTHIIDLGCGTGWAIPEILKLFPDTKISALDFSQAMLNEIDTNNGVDVFCADVHDLPFDDNSVDVVFSNMLLHWSNEQDVFAEAMRVLKPGGLLIMSCLGETSLVELKQAWLNVDKQSHVHDFPALHNLGDDLLKQGFAEVVVNAEIITLTYKHIIALMKDIKASGGHNVNENRKKGLMCRSQLALLEKGYELVREEKRGKEREEGGEGREKKKEKKKKKKERRKG
ncbi:MAG: methyltransferase domain-containing protein, partial [Proteobacteria bacterium]|nr:methyltransferase domain-containing protein [Pseudomonadota bacterium]